MLEDFADQGRSGAGDEESLLKLVRTLRTELDKIVETHERDRKSEITSSVVRGILTARKRRLEYFPERFFDEPAWDMLLVLYASELDGEPISITSVCSEAHVPSATGSRWFGTLEKEGFVRRQHDPKDKRRAWAELTPQGRSALRRYFLEQETR